MRRPDRTTMLYLMLRKIVPMSTAIHRQGKTRRSARHWALVTGLLLAAALLPLWQPQPPSGSTAPMPFLDSGEIKAVSFVGDSAFAQDSEPSTNSAEQVPKLFGMDTELLTQGEVLKKWSSAKLEISRELRIVDRCRRENEFPDGARQLISLSAEGAGRSGRARVGFINRAVDLAIHPTNDEAQWHVPDHWNTPFETLQARQGDCEDYAIVKYLALLDAGISESDLKIVLMRNVFPSEDHAVVAARVDGEWLILDNRTLTLVRDTNLTRAHPVFVLDQVGVWRFVSKNRTRQTKTGLAS
jgi:predicted transglutaminase-like cysteine proteinase